MKIATHDSATGEKGMWWCWPLTPFSRTQRLSLIEQYDAGCRLFDIRIRKYRGEWHFAHGLWVSRSLAYDALYALSQHTTEPVFVNLTYEGRSVNHDEFMSFARSIMLLLCVLDVSVKYGKDSQGAIVKYDYIWRNQSASILSAQGFLPLDGRSWHTYLPIPWLWDRLYSRPHTFTDDYYTYVDFL